MFRSKSNSVHTFTLTEKILRIQFYMKPIIIITTLLITYVKFAALVPFIHLKCCFACFQYPSI